MGARYEARHRARRQAGNGVVGLLLLLAILVGVGFWNYQRNVQAEEEDTQRPFRSHSDAQIAELIEAYEGDKAHVAERYEKLASRRVEARDRQHLEDKVREFERVQHQTRQTARLRTIRP